jgi:DNA excision repair protein ERCC-3
VAAIQEGLDKSNGAVVSRVGDEGLDFPDLDRVIEMDFLFGSRRQEGQRMGRLLHKHEGRGHHIVVMTDREFERYEKRLYALYEKGFQVEFHRA